MEQIENIFVFFHPSTIRMHNKIKRRSGKREREKIVNQQFEEYGWIRYAHLFNARLVVRYLASGNHILCNIYVCNVYFDTQLNPNHYKVEA